MSAAGAGARPAGIEAIGVRESIGAALYFGAYLAYLFWSLESELAHWVTLVLGPLLVTLAFQRPPRSLRGGLAALGLRRGHLGDGLGIALALGGAFCVMQLFLTRASGPARELVASGRALWLMPLAFVLMMLTAGFTEEFFFRGFLQARLEVLLGTRWGALLVASFCFGLFHLPYAYLNPHWPSAGDWGAAWAAALGQGVPGGLVLGGLYMARRNVLACAVLHALINTVPAMSVIRFGSG